MKKFSKVISVFLALTIIASMFTCTLSVSAANPAVNTLTGATKKSSKNLASGVTYAQYQGKAYGASSNLQFDVVEVDMSTQNLYLDNAYGGKNCEHASKTGTQILNSFKSANSSLTPIAAINADLWWMAHIKDATEINSGNSKLLSSGKINMSLGYTVSGGEIYTSDRLPDEHFVTGGTSLHYEDYVSFGITSDNVPVISNPDTVVTVKNTTKGTTTTADGINRLPINNAIIMYTDKGPTQSHCNADAVEIKIKITSTSNYVIKHGAKISGTVESVSLKNTTRPTMTTDSNYIILTARGTKYDSLSGYKKGDKVEIGVSVFDRDGKYTAQWQKVTDAVSGHLRFATDGKYTTNGVAIATYYPATLVGITKSGNVVMMTYGQDTDGTSREGIANSGITQLCKDLDLKDGFVLDGGGSTHMYLQNGSSYKYVNHPCDGNERAILNMLVLSTGPNRGAQGTIPTAPKMSSNAATIDFSNEANIGYVSGMKDTSYMPENGALKLITPAGKDPYFTVAYTKSSVRPSADKYNYVTIEYMLPATNGTAAPKAQLYFICDGQTGISARRMVQTSSLVRDGKYHTVTVNLGSNADWKGKISSIRFDYFMSATAGDTMYIKSIKLSEKAPATVTPAATATAKPTATTKPATAKPTATTKPATAKPTATTKPATVKPTATATTKPVATKKPVATATAKPNTNTTAAVKPNTTATNKPSASANATKKPTTTTKPNGSATVTTTVKPTATATVDKTLAVSISDIGENVLTDKAVVSVAEVKDTAAIDTALAAEIGDSAYTLADMSITDNGKAAELKGEIELTIDVPEGYDADKTTLYTVSDDGKLTLVDSVCASGKLTFKTAEVGVIAIVDGTEDTEVPTESISPDDETEDPVATDEETTTETEEPGEPAETAPAETAGNGEDTSADNENDADKNNDGSDDESSAGTIIGIVAAAVAAIGAAVAGILVFLKKKKKAE